MRPTVALLALLVACGMSREAQVVETSKAGPAPGAHVEKCGGDLVGTWTLDDFLYPAALAVRPMYADISACTATEQTSLTDAGISGAFSFMPDGTFSGRIKWSSRIAVLLSQECLKAIEPGKAPGVTCATIGPTIEANDRTATASCHSVESSCRCSVENVRSDQGSGHFETRDGSLIYPDVSRSSPWPYCIHGDELRAATTFSFGGKDFPVILLMHR